MYVSQKLTEVCKRIMLSVFALVLISGTIVAQNIRVTGKVTDKTGQPAIGVSVLIEGTRIGVATNLDGTFALDAPANAFLLFSSLGFEDQRVPVDNRKVINVTMAESTVYLQETVVTALGIRKEKKALGYAVQDIKSDELLKNKQTNVINSLAGKMAGVNVTQSSGAAGSGSTIIIRGGNSASESRDNQPLFVVDGVIYDNSTVNGGNSGTDGVTKTATSFGNRVMDINPADIENISILKGAAAAALYGSRAADGVVVITTKKGDEGIVKINFNSKFSYSTPGTVPVLQGTYGRGFYNQAGVFSDFTTQSWGNQITGTVYDNIKGFFNNGTIYDNSLSVSGGSKNGSFYLSASNYNQAGIVPSTGYNKTTFRFNGEQKYGKLTVGANAAYTISKTDKTLTSAGLYSGGGNGAMTALYGWARSEDMTHYLNEDGTKYRMFQGLQQLSADVENPYWIINNNKLYDNLNRFTGGITLALEVTKWFNILYRAGYDNYNSGAYTYIAPGGAVLDKYQTGRLNKSNNNYEYINSNLMLNFKKQLGDFDFNLLLGHTAEMTQRVNLAHWGYGFFYKRNSQFCKHCRCPEVLLGIYY